MPEKYRKQVTKKISPFATLALELIRRRKRKMSNNFFNHPMQIRLTAEGAKCLNNEQENNNIRKQETAGNNCLSYQG